MLGSINNNNAATWVISYVSRGSNSDPAAGNAQEAANTQKPELKHIVIDPARDQETFLDILGSQFNNEIIIRKSDIFPS